MNIVAIVGSPRKGKATDTLVDKAIEGAVGTDTDCEVKKINLADQNISYCKNCFVCWKADPDEIMAQCAIRDDMDGINRDLLKADSLILGTPVHMGYATAIMTSFLERLCWVFAKPEGRYLNITQCPVPRSDKKRKAVIIITSGLIPPVYRRFCDDTSPLIRQTIKESLNAKTIGDLYAGDIMHRGAEFYFDKAVKLGSKIR